MPRKPKKKVFDKRTNPNVGSGKKLLDSVLKEFPKRKSRFHRIKRGLISTSFSAAALGITFFGGKAKLEQRANIKAERAAITQTINQEKLVRNPEQMARVCQIYGWNPTISNDIRKIRLIEDLSRKTGVSVPRVLRTLEQNDFHGDGYNHTMWALGNKKRSKGTVPETKKRITRIETILRTVANSGFAEELQIQIRNNRGSLDKIRKLERSSKTN